MRRTHSSGAPLKLASGNNKSVLDPLAVNDYRFLLNSSSARIVAFDFSEPVKTDCSLDQFVKNIRSIDSACTECNPAFAKMHGNTPSDALIGLSINALLPKSRGYDDLLNQWHKAKFSKDHFTCEVGSYSGAPEALQVACYSDTLEPGSNLGFRRLWIVLRDITTEKRNLEAISNAEEHFRKLVERPGLVLVRITRAGRFLYMSPSVGELLGYKPNQFNDDPSFLRQSVHVEDLPAFDVMYRAFQAQVKTPLEGEFRVKGSNGTFRWFFTRMFPMVDSSGKIEYYDFIAVDIEERKQLERRLEHAQRLDTIGTLASGIAHDFNNHLTAIIGQLTAGLQGLPTTHPSYESFRAAEHATLCCAEIAKQLLTLGRGNVGSQKVLDPGELAEDVVQLLKHLMPQKIEVCLSIEQPIDAVIGDPTQLMQVIMNLAINARDAMHGGGRLKIDIRKRRVVSQKERRLYPGAGFGDFIEIAVSDSGVGIPTDKIERIFEPFFTTKESGKGSGLGLSMVYSIVKAHGGTIAVSSTVGVGTSFRVLLPAIENNLPHTIREATPVQHAGSGCVLIADDDEMVRAMLAQTLTLQGYTVITAQNGEEALELYKSKKDEIDFVLLDDTMPKISGRDVAAAIRKISIKPKLILTSGYGLQHVSKSGNLENIAYLGKPFSMQELIKILAEI